MTSVELIYDADCPNAPVARAQLLRAFAAAKLTPHWREWERGHSDSPEYVRDYGSPTILVNGRDVALEAGVADCCRVYASESGQLERVPPLRRIDSALRAVPQSLSRQARMNAFAASPAVGLALLPKLTCPACWPAYAAVLSAAGLGFLDYTPYLLPLTTVFLAVTLVALGYRAKNRRGYLPLLLGLVGSAIVIFGKFVFDSDPTLYAGITLLVVASVWNSWPSGRNLCPACEPKGEIS
ncbi:MAG: MerC domain-containing protein [Burkholderiales bacterium]